MTGFDVYFAWIGFEENYLQLLISDFILNTLIQNKLQMDDNDATRSKNTKISWKFESIKLSVVESRINFRIVLSHVCCEYKSKINASQSFVILNNFSSWNQP